MKKFVIKKKLEMILRDNHARIVASRLDEFAQAETLEKNDGTTFQHVFCKSVCNHATCIGICIVCGKAASRGGYYSHKDSHTKVIKYKAKCHGCSTMEAKRKNDDGPMQL